MSWQVILALVLAIPIILLPVLFIWYMNTGGLVRAFQTFRVMRKAAQGRATKATVSVEQIPRS